MVRGHEAVGNAPLAARGRAGLHFPGPTGLCTKTDADVVRRRNDGGWRNFQQIYRDLVDAWALYDSSAESPVLVSMGRGREQG